MSDTADEERTSCVSCGRMPPPEERASASLTWSRGIERGRIVWTCPVCTRKHARAIEGKLDSEWW